jgi:hypothetical protein
MTKRDLIEALEKYPDHIEIGVPCGKDSDDEFLYSEEIVIEEMETKEPSGIDPDGQAQEEMVPMIMLIPAEGPWADAMTESEEGDGEDQ